MRKRAKKNAGCDHRFCVLVEPQPNNPEKRAVVICRLCGAVRQDAFGRSVDEWGPPLSEFTDAELRAMPAGARSRIL